MNFDDVLSEHKKQLHIELNQMKSLIGKYFKFKEKFDDKYYTFVKVVRINDDSIGLIVDEYKKRDDYNIIDEISIQRDWASVDSFNNMTEIPVGEFEYEVKQLLNLLKLDFYKGDN